MGEHVAIGSGRGGDEELVVEGNLVILWVGVGFEVGDDFSQRPVGVFREQAVHSHVQFDWRETLFLYCFAHDAGVFVRSVSVMEALLVQCLQCEGR